LTSTLGEFFTDLEVGIAPGAGYFVHYETPDRAAEEVRRFFGRVFRDGTSQAAPDG
jgi:epoxide hydrolase 4